MKRALVGLILAAVLSACGSRGVPLPPLDKTPPPFPEMQVLQRGSDLIVQFGALPAVVNVNGAMVSLTDVEILLLEELYPALTPDLLALALDQERRTRLRDAREAATQARDEVDRRREAAAAAAAAAEAEAAGVEGEVEAEPELPITEEPEAEDGGEEERELTADELAIRRVPRTVLAEWRAAEVRPDALLDAAYRLQRAVDTLWAELDMPAAIVDLREPPALPDPGEVYLTAQRVQRTLTYEAAPDIEEFLREAQTVALIPFDELDALRTADRIEYTYPIPAPAVATVRTRYIFGIRAISESGDDGRVGNLLPMAPALVPEAPISLVTRILPTGIELEWQPPATDIAGNPIDPQEIRYNVYRRELPAALMGSTPRNPLPLADTEWIDTTTRWQERYVYEVRAVAATPADIEREENEAAAISEPAPVAVDPAAAPAATVIRKESGPLASAEIFAEDTFPPPSPGNLQAVRAGSRVNLRWSASAATDLAGYRVYRHRAPAPEIPGLVKPPVAPQQPVPTGAAETADPQAEAAEVVDPEAETVEAADPEGEVADPETGEEAVAGTVAGTAEAAVAETPAEMTPEQEEAAARERRRQRRRNELVEAGWELLTTVVISQVRYLDPSSDPDVTWIYVVEAVDASQNVSPPVAVTLETDSQQ